ncbi:MAG TPA: hypothetical protein VIT44_06150, partial [Cyclobacteriaceae bacterium]
MSILYLVSVNMKGWPIGLIIILLLPLNLIAQKKEDSLRHQHDTTNLFQNLRRSQLGKQLERSVTRRSFSDTVKQEKSEDKLKPYQGKIIRNIHVEHIGFNKSIYNSDKKVKSSVTHFANSLHTDTRSKIIKQHLFFFKGQRVNPYRLADNERYLRDLDFILDSRIIVEPIEGSEDSVDVHVVTRDVFSLGARINPDPTRFKLGIYDANLMGNAQRVDVTFLFQNSRDPKTGFNAYYRKSSLFGSLTNLTVGFTQLNNASSYGNEYEYAYFGRLDRPLVSPYSRWAGGVEVSRNWSRNVSSRPDSIFLNYQYNIQDYWGGYNIGVNNTVNNRARQFIGVRYFQQQFINQPIQDYEQLNPLYNNKRMVLAALTFYNQNFYKTSYVYGFGRTEDVPYGTNFTITTGWSRELNLERPYLSADFVKSFVEPKGNFYSFRAAAGGYPKNNIMQDAIVLASARLFSKLLQFKKVKIRQLVEGGYSELFNQRTNLGLTLNNQIKGFSPDSLYGYRRFYAHSETTFFTGWNFLGFRFAPFAAFEGGILQEKDKNLISV